MCCGLWAGLTALWLLLFLISQQNGERDTVDIHGECRTTRGRSCRCCKNKASAVHTALCVNGGTVSPVSLSLPGFNWMVAVVRKIIAASTGTDEGQGPPLIEFFDPEVQQVGLYTWLRTRLPARFHCSPKNVMRVKCPHFAELLADL